MHILVEMSMKMVINYEAHPQGLLAKTVLGPTTVLTAFGHTEAEADARLLENVMGWMSASEHLPQPKEIEINLKQAIGAWE